MVENLVEQEQDGWFLDTPYIRKWRERIEEVDMYAKETQNQLKQVEEALHQAEEARRGFEKARLLFEEAYRQPEEALNKKIDWVCETRRQDILNLVVTRYNPPMQAGLRLQKYLSTLTDDDKFKAIFEAIIHVEDFEQFYMIVEQAASGEELVGAGL